LHDAAADIHRREIGKSHFWALAKPKVVCLLVPVVENNGFCFGIECGIRELMVSGVNNNGICHLLIHMGCDANYLAVGCIGFGQGNGSKILPRFLIVFFTKFM